MPVADERVSLAIAAAHREKINNCQTPIGEVAVYI
jgi:hypothetical protein